MVKFENREIWADLENRSKVVHSENFPIWWPASGDRDHVTHHVTSHVTHWGQWKYASRSWHAVGNHRRQLKLMYRSKISGRGPKHCSGSKFQCRPRPGHVGDGGYSPCLFGYVTMWVGASQSDAHQPIRTSVSETKEAVYRPMRGASWDEEQTRVNWWTIGVSGQVAVRPSRH